MVPPAPARFSTTMVWANCGPSCSKINLGTMSVVLPAANGTTTRMILDGQVWAPAGMAAQPRRSRTDNRRTMAMSLQVIAAHEPMPPMLALLTRA